MNLALHVHHNSSKNEQHTPYDQTDMFVGYFVIGDRLFYEVPATVYKRGPCQLSIP
jgi:hypothetical protein